jgi:hypothetical protein
MTDKERFNALAEKIFITYRNNLKTLAMVKALEYADDDQFPCRVLPPNSSHIAA